MAVLGAKAFAPGSGQCLAAPSVPRRAGRAAGRRQRTAGALVLGAALSLAAATAAGPAAGQSPPLASDEYAIKAAFLYNFAKFVEWPNGVFAAAEAPLALCVLGADPFGGELDMVVQGKTAQGHPVVVRRLDGLGAVARCHILFVSSSEQERFAEVLGAVAGRSVLTVGEDGEFARAGGMISFVLREQRVRFAIDAGAAERAGLRLSSRLLDLAEPVHGSDRRGRRR